MENQPSWYQAGGKSPMDNPTEAHMRTALGVGGCIAGGSIAGG